MTVEGGKNTFHHTSYTHVTHTYSHMISLTGAEHVFSEGPSKCLPARVVMGIHWKCVIQHSCPMDKAPPSILIPDARGTKLVACPGVSRVHLPITDKYVGQTLGIRHINYSAESHHSKVLMELASGQPTRRPESVTDVVVFPFARENSRTEVNTLLNSPGQLAAGRPVHRHTVV